MRRQSLLCGVIVPLLLVASVVSAQGKGYGKPDKAQSRGQGKQEKAAKADRSDKPDKAVRALRGKPDKAVRASQDKSDKPAKAGKVRISEEFGGEVERSDFRAFVTS